MNNKAIYRASLFLQAADITKRSFILSVTEAYGIFRKAAHRRVCCQCQLNTSWHKEEPLKLAPGWDVVTCPQLQGHVLDIKAKGQLHREAIHGDIP